MLLSASDLEEYIGQRLDKVLSSKLSISRSKIQSMLLNSEILINNSETRANHVLKKSDNILIKDIVVDESKLEYEDLKLNIVYDSKSFFVVEKPAFMVTHPGEDGVYRSGTLINGLLNMIDVDQFEDKLRPGIVHRLDKNTSGLLLVAKNLEAYNFYVKEFKKRNLKKFYKTLVVGEVKYPEALIDSPIGRDSSNRKKMSVVNDKSGKEAKTYFKLIQYYHYNYINYSLLDIDLLTGRTHQIRVHMKSINFSVLGDDVYGSNIANKYALENFDLNRQFLHAYRLEFVDFDLKAKRVCEISLASDLQSVLSKLKNGIYKR